MSSATLKFRPWGTLRFCPVIMVFVFLAISEFNFGNSCFTKHPSKTCSRRLIRYNSINVPAMNVTAEELSRSSEPEPPSSSPTSPPSFDSNVKSSLFRFVMRDFFAKKLPADTFIKRLDDLKENLLAFYAKRTLLESLLGSTSTSVSTGRDKKIIGFPSLEGALLSLTFLTFSVMLIDMIQTLLAKLKLRAPAVTVAPAIIGRRFYDTGAASPREREWKDTFKETITTLSSQVLSASENPRS